MPYGFPFAKIEDLYASLQGAEFQLPTFFYFLTIFFISHLFSRVFVFFKNFSCIGFPRSVFRKVFFSTPLGLGISGYFSIGITSFCLPLLLYRDVILLTSIRFLSLFRDTTRLLDLLLFTSK